MKILFIRHGETVANVKRVYAGITDSPLTSHGILQAEKLGVHVKQHFPAITHAFASPLSRARKTCETVVGAQDNNNNNNKSVEVKIVKDLEEQDFGSYEGEPFLSTVPLRERRKFRETGSSGSGNTPKVAAGTKRKKEVEEDDSVMTAGEQGPLTGTEEKVVPNQPEEETEKEKKHDKGEDVGNVEEEELEEYKEMESIQHISARADRFVKEYIVPLLPAAPVSTTTSKPSQPQSSSSSSDQKMEIDNNNSSSKNGSEKKTEEQVKTPMVIIVSHGIFLSHLWKSFISLFPPTSVLATTPVVERGWYQGKNPGWGNTAYLHVSVFASGGGPIVKGNMTVVIEGVNEKDHLKNLKKTGGGVGNEVYDEKQKKMDSFLVKKAVDSEKNGTTATSMSTTTTTGGNKEGEEEHGKEEAIPTGAELKKVRTE